MSKDIPEIDDLTRGINDSELILTQNSVETQVEQKEKNNEAQEKDTAVSLSDTGCWDDFMEYLQSDDSKTDKTERLVCKLDRDLADSLDDCDIHGRCRSDLVNAIVRHSSSHTCHVWQNTEGKRNHCLTVIICRI